LNESTRSVEIPEHFALKTIGEVKKLWAESYMNFASECRAASLVEMPLTFNNESIKRDGDKTGRNDPCPCGSGKKYKKCCL